MKDTCDICEGALFIDNNWIICLSCDIVYRSPVILSRELDDPEDTRPLFDTEKAL